MLKIKRNIKRVERQHWNSTRIVCLANFWKRKDRKVRRKIAECVSRGLFLS